MTDVAEEFYKWYCLRIMKSNFFIQIQKCEKCDEVVNMKMP